MRLTIVALMLVSLALCSCCHHHATYVQSSAAGEVKATYFLSIEVHPGHALELYFIPVKAGRYDLVCTMEGQPAWG